MTGNANFFAALMAAGRAAPDAQFLRGDHERLWRYGDMDALSAHYAGALIDAGAKPGDRIAAQVEKSPENIALYLAALRAGLVYTPLNMAYTPDELAYFLQDSEPSIFVCDPRSQAAHLAIAPSDTKTLTLDANGGGSLPAVARGADPFERTEDRNADDLAAILYTSGTTGRSKGAMLTHENLSANARALVDAWSMSPDDTLLHALPMFHIHGLFVALHTALLAGADILFHRRFDAEAVRRDLPNASILMGVPTFYTRLLALSGFSAMDCRTIRLFVSGSAPLSADDHAAFEKRTGLAILERYGMSEAGILTSNPIDGDRVAGTVGFPLPGVDLRIAGDGSGAVQVKGPGVFKGYWRMPEKTAEDLSADGWFNTGDIGRLAEDGRLTLVGRVKDLIIAGGYNIYPSEIEPVLNAVPGVVECAVIGLPHSDLGEAVTAVLVARPGAAISGLDPSAPAFAHALEKLARFKRPRRFFWTDALPRNALGKVRKQALRERYKNAYSATSAPAP